MTGSLRDILPSAAALLGVPAGADRLGLRELVGTRPRVLLVLVDGMGLHLLDRMAQHAPFLASMLEGRGAHLSELSATFPSTTPTSLVSLTTGAWPGEHGVLGFTVLVPGTSRVLTHITWGGDPVPESWQPRRTWFQHLTESGVDARAVLPAAFESSGLTRAAYRGARFRAIDSARQTAATIVDDLRSGPGLVYGYTSVLDTAAHRHGIASPQWAAAAATVDRMLCEIAGQLPPDSLLLVTADHGGIDVPTAGRFDAGTDPRLSEGISAIAGEPRVRYLHTLDGAGADVAANWRAVLGTSADVLEREEAVESGLFGPVSAAHLGRIGDLVVICRDRAVVLATGHEPAEVSSLVGFHGALTPEEVAIPLLVIPG